MADYAHELTDRELTALEKKIAREYERARDKVQERVDKFFDTFREGAEKLYKAISDAPDATTRLAAEKAYKDFVWRKTVAAKNITDLRDKLAADLTAINQRSAALIGNRMNGIFSLNHNFAAYELEHGLGLNLQFTLYDEFTVARLLQENPKLLPKPKIDIALDKKWNAQKITSEITQGILTGESIPKIARRLQSVTDMNRNSAIRNARTAITGAENAGRIESYHYAESIGITLQKEWLATLDDRTRDEHRDLDGQRVDIDEPFRVGGDEIMFPGDPNAEGYLVYNCRCTLISAVEGVKDLDPVYRRDNISGEKIDNMSYREWEAARRGEG
jgi:SPP1 gp7 family putative phage head morphogenesis protein